VAVVSDADDPRRARHDWDGDDPLSYTVVEAVAAARGVDAAAVAPLSDDVDLEALDRLARSLRSGVGRVSFGVDDVHVSVTADGRVTARRTPAGDAPSDDWFADVLGRLVTEAAAAGVPVEGGWACRDPRRGREWGVEVCEIRRRRDDETAGD
jgi:hypothetical protein